MSGFNFLLAALVGCQPHATVQPITVQSDSVEFGRFGSVALYGDRTNPSQVVLFVSGDGGWNLGVVDMAREVASLGALVVGIDIRRYLAAVRTDTISCAYPAADFEALSQFVQKHLGLPHYTMPILAGYSSGATLVYAVLAEAPPATFRGAISLGFCPDLPLSRKLCPGAGLLQEFLPSGRGVRFGEVKQLPAPWVVLQGDADQVCNPDSTRAYVRSVGGADISLLPGVGHGFGVQSHWLPAFHSAYARIANDSTYQTHITDAAVADLPLTMVPAPSTEVHRRTVAVMMSGDGGWAGLDRGVAGALAANGVPVIGFNSLQYFWQRRTPDRFATDLARVIEHGLSATGTDSVILIGYSLGADVLPFGINRLPDQLRRRVSVVTLIGPSNRASFEFHIGSWLGETSASDLQTLPEIKQVKAEVPAARLICVYGSDETTSACPANAAAGFVPAILPGGHHLNGDYFHLAEIAMGNKPVSSRRDR